nr:30S ribosomal protein S7 [Candidatus Kapabacteria bacterium]
MRKRRAEKRRPMPDPRYNDIVVSKLVNSIMIQGKKTTALSIVYDAFDIMEQRAKKDALEI